MVPSVKQSRQDHGTVLLTQDFEGFETVAVPSDLRLTQDILIVNNQERVLPHSALEQVPTVGDHRVDRFFGHHFPFQQLLIVQDCAEFEHAVAFSQVGDELAVG